MYNLFNEFIIANCDYHIHMWNSAHIYMEMYISEMAAMPFSQRRILDSREFIAVTSNF